MPSPAAQSSALGSKTAQPLGRRKEASARDRALGSARWAAPGKSLGLSEQPQSLQVRHTNSSFVSPGFVGEMHENTGEDEHSSVAVCDCVLRCPVVPRSWWPPGL